MFSAGSDENLPHDRHLLSLMDDQGWVPISDIAGFNRVNCFKVCLFVFVSFILFSWFKYIWTGK